MENFYRRFLPKITQILSPLMDLLKGKDLSKVLPWDEYHDVTFADTAVLLVHGPQMHPTCTSEAFCSSRYMAIGSHLAFFAKVVGDGSGPASK
jgi:hypothetical protein